MSATRGRRSPSPLVLLAAVVPGLLVGCTICPSPYDYAGPVPNGSAPQSDFRARSGGILPIGTTPRPWPTLVQGAEADAAGAIEGPDAIDDTVLTTAAVDPAVTDAAPAAVPTAEHSPGDDSVPPTGPAEPAPVTAAPDAAPALAETPGWRPRRAADEGR